MKRRRFLHCALGTAGLAGFGWHIGYPRTKSTDLCKISRSGRALGTEVHITVFAASEAQGEDAIRAAFTEIERVESLLSLYRPNSQLCQLNSEGILQSPAPELVGLLQKAAHLSRQTDGAFDVTVQPLWELHARHARHDSIPSGLEIKEARRRVHWNQVVMGRDGVRLEGSAQVTLNGIAQGYAADAATASLAKHGIRHAILDTGEVGTLGRNAERNHWAAGIQHPREPGLLGIVHLDRRCLATSGDYETIFTKDGGSHHLFDPTTGMSATTCASVSVVAPTATEADALSTACFVLGVERGMALVASRPMTDALFVTKDGQITRSERFPIDLI